MQTFEKINDALKDAQVRLEQMCTEFEIVQAQRPAHMTFRQMLVRQIRNGLLAERAALLRLGLAISQGDR